MPTTRVIRTLVVFVLAVAAWAANPHKELVRLQIGSRSGAPVQLRVTTHGLLILEPQAMRTPQSTEVSTTISTPTRLTLAGIGEAEIEAVDPAASLVADVTQVRANAPPALRLTGRAIHIDRATAAEPYRVTAVGNTATSERR
jgi:hypothetical protein